MEIEAKEAKFPREACDAVAAACIWRQTGAVGRAVCKGPQNLAFCCMSNELWSWGGGGGSLLPQASSSLPAAPEDNYHTPLAPQSPKVPGCWQSASQMIPANSQHPNSTLLGSSSLIPHCRGHPLTFALSKRDPWGAPPYKARGYRGPLAQEASAWATSHSGRSGPHPLCQDTHTCPLFLPKRRRSKTLGVWSPIQRGLHMGQECSPAVCQCSFSHWSPRAVVTKYHKLGG